MLRLMQDLICRANLNQAPRIHDGNAIRDVLHDAKIMGDENGISVISVSDEGKKSDTIPVVLQDAVSQLNDYFEGNRTDFTFKLNPSGTEKLSPIACPSL